MGCIKVSVGCARCYMYRMRKRLGMDPAIVVRSKTRFRHPQELRGPKKIFTCSLSDFFIDQADGWRDEAFEVIRSTPWHTYQILTKRPKRMLDCMKAMFMWLGPALYMERFGHVWLGVSVENQAAAEERIPLLRLTPCALRFVSVEPMLSAVDLSRLLSGGSYKIGWVVVGGESGPGRRNMEMKWLVSIVSQCKAAGIPCFVKQDSCWQAGRQGRIPDEIWTLKEFPDVEPRAQGV